MSSNLKKEWTGVYHALFMIAGWCIGVWMMAYFGQTEESIKLKAECERDLIRDLECEMRFVKPEVNHDNG